MTPNLEVNAGNVEGVWFGGASVATWDKNRIALALPSGGALLAGGGCTACVGIGQSCPSACQSSGVSDGVCAVPGSTNPGQCCACSSDGCDGYHGASNADCNAACTSAGKAGGWCAAPGSTNPAQCCACLP